MTQVASPSLPQPLASRCSAARAQVSVRHTNVPTRRGSSNSTWVMEGVQHNGLLANSHKEIHNGRAGVSDTTFHTYAFAALCRAPILGSKVTSDTPETLLGTSNF